MDVGVLQQWRSLIATTTHRAAGPSVVIGVGSALPFILKDIATGVNVSSLLWYRHDV